LDSQVRA